MVKSEVNLAVKGKIKNNKDVVFMVVSLFISVASLYFLTGPAYTGILAAQKENSEKEKDLQNKQELLKNIQAFNKENQTAGIDSRKLTAFISNRNNYEDYLFHLKELAKQSNVEVVSMDLQSGNSGVSAAAPSVHSADNGTANNAGDADIAAMTDEADASNKLQEQHINVSIRGSFENISYFYKILENGIPFTQEVSADFSIGKEQTDAPDNSQEQDLNPIIESKIDIKFNYY